MIRKPWLFFLVAFFLVRAAVGQDDGPASKEQGGAEPVQTVESATGSEPEQQSADPTTEEVAQPDPGEPSEPQETSGPDAEVVASDTPAESTDDESEETSGDIPGEPAIDVSEMSAADMLREFQVLYRSERLPEALDMAEQLVTYESRRQPPYSPELIQPVLNLAEVRVASGQPQAALRTYSQAIDLIERDGGIFDERLIDPLVQSGRVLSAGGQTDDATNLFLRAQHVVHRDDGVFSPDQLDALDFMTENYLAARDYESADKVQNFAYAISYRVYQDQPRRVVAAMIKLAEFQQRIGLYDAARRRYIDAINYTEEKLEGSDIQMVTLMKGLGRLGMHEQMTGIPHVSSVGASGVARAATPDLYQGRKEATLALEQTIELMEQFPNDVTPVDRAYAYLDLGDWYLMINKPQESTLAYQNAWDILAAEPNADELLANTFGQPKRIRYRRPPLPSNGVPGAYENYDGTYVELRFRVEVDGSVSDITIVDANTPVALRNDMRRAVSRSLFRPKYVDGQPVASDGMRIRETFAGTSWERRN